MSSMDPTSSVECGSDVPTLASCTQESGALSNDTASTQQSAVSVGLTVSALVVTTALLVVLVGWISYRVRKRWERQQREIEEAEAAAEAAARKADEEMAYRNCIIPVVVMHPDGCYHAGYELHDPSTPVCHSAKVQPPSGSIAPQELALVSPTCNTNTRTQPCTTRRCSAPRCHARRQRRSVEASWRNRHASGALSRSTGLSTVGRTDSASRSGVDVEMAGSSDISGSRGGQGEGGWPEGVCSHMAGPHQ